MSDANSSSIYYTKAEADALLNAKANVANVYNKDQINSSFKPLSDELANKPALRAAINSKGGTLTSSDNLSAYTIAVNNIKIGVDVSSDTVVAAAVLSGYTFHNSDGVSVSGVIVSKDSATYTPGTTSQTIPAGQFLAGAQIIQGDGNLVASNIASGITVFGVTGTHSGGTDVSTDTVNSSVVLSGYTFHTSAGIGASGTITTVDHGAPEVTISNGQVIATHSQTSGYVAATTTTSKVVTLSIDASKVLAGQEVYGVTGTATNDANATNAQILSGKTAYVSGVKVTGTIASYSGSSVVTPSNVSKTLATSGKYLSGDITVNTDSNLLASNIKKDVTIFGVTGSLEEGGDTTYYKCVSVVEPSSGGVLVSGATAATSFIEGTYTLQDSSATGYDRVWVKGNYKIFYVTDGEWEIRDNNNTLYAYKYTGSDPWGGTWYDNDTGVSPCPTVTQSPSTPGSWTGYKAIYTSGVLSWDSTTSSGLAISGAITPVVDGVYNADATKQLTENLIASNIRKDVAVMGVTGTMEAGTDVSSDTVTADKVLSGYTFHGSNGSGGTGTIPNASMSYVALNLDSANGIVNGSAATTFGYFASGGSMSKSLELPTLGSSSYTPTTSNIVISGGKFITGDQTIAGDANLVASNIKKDVAMFGITGTYEGAGGATSFYKCATVDSTTSTWTGYKAVLSSGVYSFESTATSGLVYTSKTPILNECYDDGALIGPADLWQGSEAGLLFYAPFSESKASAETGQTLTPAGVTYASYKSLRENRTITGALFSAEGSGIECTSGVDDICAAIADSQEFTVSLWATDEGSAASQTAAYMYLGESSNYIAPTYYYYSFIYYRPYLQINGTSYMPSGDVQLYAYDWKHLVMTWKNSTLTRYLNGSSVGSVGTQGTLSFGSSPVLKFANTSAFTRFPGYIAAVRIYDYCVDTDKIAELYAEFPISE